MRFVFVIAFDVKVYMHIVLFYFVLCQHHSYTKYKNINSTLTFGDGIVQMELYIGHETSSKLHTIPIGNVTTARQHTRTKKETIFKRQKVHTITHTIDK